MQGLDRDWGHYPRRRVRSIRWTEQLAGHCRTAGKTAINWLVQTTCFTFASVVVLLGVLPGHAQTSAPATAPSEKSRTIHFETGVRVHLNWPEADPNAGRTGGSLIFYLLPNGNTIEQTAGCVCPDADWHYRIQHIGAQVRRLREAIPEETFVVAYLQADGKSWPAWKSKNANYRELIPRIVAAVVQESGLDRPSMSLVAHSGGGAFITGFIDSFPDIPDRLDRIAFLDANYSYSDENRHGDKLLRWLGKSGRHVLSVICYDDREITLNGKKVLGPTGGTWRATHRMFDRFRKDVELKETVTEPIVHVQGLEGRIDVLMHKNPDNKILHTALVGEMGGLIHAMTVAGPHAGKAGRFGDASGYQRWIPPEPLVTTTQPSQTPGL